jgi:hypothetical protein
MSWLNDIVKVATTAVGFIGGWGTVASIAASFVLNRVTNTTKPQPAQSSPRGGGADAATTVDPGVRQQIDANSGNSIPVVYGRTIIGGKIFDAYLSDDKLTMYFAIAICERTSEYTINGEWLRGIVFENVYWNGQRCIFGAGSSDYSEVTALYNDGSGTTTSLTPNGDKSPLSVYLYNKGGRGSTIIRSLWPSGGTGDGSVPWASTIMPNWTDAHKATDLVMAVVKIKYNKALNVTGLGNWAFEVNNPLNRPGDVLYDYMLNTRYGAGINAAEISV